MALTPNDLANRPLQPLEYHSKKAHRFFLIRNRKPFSVLWNHFSNAAITAFLSPVLFPVERLPYTLGFFLVKFTVCTRPSPACLFSVALYGYFPLREWIWPLSGALCPPALSCDRHDHYNHLRLWKHGLSSADRRAAAIPRTLTRIRMPIFN